ncbi:hypothetical protein K239x_18940 [Planctomycetes bacterium K23_9]|uniref:Planctomycete cytochrome C n=1 Tax=Stieleria marina TaxID=1930275 RepID=A0A517NS34_9BACT|nr:hypothetical protein K239x_18940 [Planctomycetes bacterium K23_9]
MPHLQSPVVTLIRTAVAVVLIGGFALGDFWVGVSHAAETVPRQILNPFLAKYCGDCHADGADEGGLSLDDLGDNLNDAATFARWERLFDRVADGEMPPVDSEQPTMDVRSAFSKALALSLATEHANTKGTVLRRLNRSEYQNTMNDLFGTRLKLKELLPEDGRSHEFENVGESLNVSLVQLEQYIAAAEGVLDSAIARTSQKPTPKTKVANYAETREAEKHLGKAWLHAADGSVVFFQDLVYPTGMLRTANTQAAGRYRIKVTGYAYQSTKPITFRVGSTTFARGAERPTYGYYSFEPGDPQTIELEADIEDRYMVEIAPWGIFDDHYEIKNKGIQNYQGPGLAIKQVELVGPLTDEFPSRGHQLIFDGLTRTEVEPRNPETKGKSWYVPVFDLQADDAPKDIANVLQRVATAAFRRPTKPIEVADFVELYQSQIDEGETMERALRTAVVAIFSSPEFLFLSEQKGWLDDYAIASRLAYFLTRTTPDQPLLDDAAKSLLSRDPQVLLGHATRLLNDERHQRFINDFTDAWLNLRDIEFTSPDKRLYPEYDAFLKFSMLRETRRFVDELITQNLPVRNIVQSDFAMLNNRLAKLYQIDGVEGPQIRRVAIPDGHVRGGLLTQASTLKVSANGTNTSPVVRGVWVMERIVGKRPSPPPPGIPGVEPDSRGASTLRELLAKHRDSDSCRSCHRMIDPPGFALESFNPIGGWRDRFRSLGDGERVVKEINGRKVRYKLGPPVDASGQLANGKQFDGFREFRDLLADDEDALTKSFVTKLLTFATGREMGFSDRDAIGKLVAQSKIRGHGVGDLIKLVVTSDAFRRK